MKKLLSVLVVVFALFLFACQATCAHENLGAWEGDENNHWHLCKDCNEEVGKEAHTFGEWEIVTNAAVGQEGLQKKVCSVCSYYVTEVIPAIVVATGEAAEEVAVYVQVPAEWTEVMCYYWGDNVDGSHKVGWPGAAMTQVDAENNVWGFIVPAGTANVIFNNNAGTQTIDLAFGTETNLYALQEANAEGKWTVDYTSHTPAADEPELNKYAISSPETFRDIYVKVPAEWTAVYFHFWGAGVGTEWPGDSLTAIDAENGVYSVKLSSKATGVIFHNNAGQQTANIEPNEAVNAYVITIAEDSSVKCENNTYADGVFTPVQVKVEVVLFVKGSMNSWSDNDDYKLSVNGTTATIEIALAENDEFKIANSSWSVQFGFAGLKDANEACFADKDGNILCLAAGTYVITVENYNEDSRTCTIVPKA